MEKFLQGHNPESPQHATASKEQSETAELRASIDKIWEIAHGFGLDPYPTHFEMVPPSIMYEFGAYGLPGRYSHWTHGKAYHQIKTQYDYGLSKIYELVVNTNPSYAFLMEGNSLIQNKMVAAHVLAHTDFFKNNAYFQATNRQMDRSVQVHSERIDRYAFEHGEEEVEKFLDTVLSIEQCIDPYDHSQPATLDEYQRQNKRNYENKKRSLKPVKTDYDDIIHLGEKAEPVAIPKNDMTTYPVQEDQDILNFLAVHSPSLEPWQRDIIEIVREEMIYFLPQMKTKIMNEGWASYWHLRIMREMDISNEEFVEFSKMHSGVLAPSKTSLNPYHIGLKIFEDIENRWDNPTEDEKKEMGRRGGEGRKKMFEVRETESDRSFINNYLTQELVDDMDLYIYKQEGDELKVVAKDYRVIRDSFVRSMDNLGQPVIKVAEGGGDYNRTGQLYLVHHREEGQPALDIDYAKRTLKNIRFLWPRPVHLQTKTDKNNLLLTCYDESKDIEIKPL